MHLDRFQRVLALVAIVTASGCAAAEEDITSGSEAAFTVDRGDRFVESATPTRIVLRKRVDNVMFPFDERGLVGKALLIHPIEERGATGVYARAKSVTDDGDRYVVESEPLSLAEMGEISEDAIVRIFINPRPAPFTMTTTHAAALHPLTSKPANRLEFTSFKGLTRPDRISPSVGVSHSIETARLSPEILVDWTREHGLELGARASLEWRSTLTITGRATAEIFRSAAVMTPSQVLFVPIGPVPVPIMIQASAFVVCQAIVAGPLQASFTFAAEASFGGSVYAQPSRDPSTWLSQGSWAPQANGTASVTPNVTAGVETAITCAVPRVQVDALIAGVAGPVVAIAPNITLGQNRATVGVAMTAGIETTFGTKEVTLFEWKP